MFWVALGGLLHARQAKRLYAPIVAGGTLGEIVGSFASGAIGQRLRHRRAAAGRRRRAAARRRAGDARRRGARRARLTQPPRPTAAATAPNALALFGPIWRESRLFRILAVSALLCGVLGPMLYFQFSYVADQATRGADGELRLLGAVRRLPRLAQRRRAGAAAASARRASSAASACRSPRRCSPLVYLLGFFGVSVRLGLEAAVGAMAGATLQDHAIYDPAQRVLVTLFPERLRPAATTLIEGPVQRAGGALGNVIVLAIIAVGTPAWVGVRRPADRRAVGRRGAHALAHLSDAAARGGERPPVPPPRRHRRARAGRRRHGTRARSGARRSRRASRARRVRPGARRAARGRRRRHWPAPPARAEPPRGHCCSRPCIACSTAPPTHSSPRQPPRASSKRCSSEADGVDPLARAFLIEAYARLSPELCAGSRGAQLLDALCAGTRRRRCDWPPPPACTRPATWRSPTADLDEMLAAALASDDPASRHVALDELRALLLAPFVGAGRDSTPPADQRWTSRIALVAERLADPRDRARAAEILADVAARYGPRLARARRSPARPSARSRAARAHRRAALHRRHPGGSAAAPGGRPSRLRRRGRGGGGRRRAARRRPAGDARPDRRAAARTPRRRATPRCRCCASCTSHPPRCTTLIDREIARIQRLVLHATGSPRGRRPELVLQRLRERIDEGAHGTLLLLAALRDDDRLAALGAAAGALPRTGAPRAVLLEALEALLPPADRARLLPLLDDNVAARRRGVDGTRPPAPVIRRGAARHAGRGATL